MKVCFVCSGRLAYLGMRRQKCLSLFREGPWYSVVRFQTLAQAESDAERLKTPAPDIYIGYRLQRPSGAGDDFQGRPYIDFGSVAVHQTEIDAQYALVLRIEEFYRLRVGQRT